MTAGALQPPRQKGLRTAFLRVVVEQFGEEVEQFGEEVEQFGEEVEQFGVATSAKVLLHRELSGVHSADYPDYPDYPEGVRGEAGAQASPAPALENNHTAPGGASPCSRLELSPMTNP